jgi:hypothetical protein
VIDAMTLLDVEELVSYWIDHPPVHLLLGAYLGLGKNRARVRRAPPEARAPSAAPRDVGQLVAELGPAFQKRDVNAGLGPAVLDINELRQKALAEAGCANPVKARR